MDLILKVLVLGSKVPTLILVVSSGSWVPPKIPLLGSHVSDISLEVLYEKDVLENFTKQENT